MEKTTIIILKEKKEKGAVMNELEIVGELTNNMKEQAISELLQGKTIEILRVHLK